MSVQVENEIIKTIFLNPKAETIDGVIAVGGSLEVELLVLAYDRGVFPWPHENYPLLWFCPDERGILDFTKLHLPRSFKKWLNTKSANYTIKFNSDFDQIITECREQKRKGQSGTWITENIQVAYQKLFKNGHAFCLGVYSEQMLVGGIYGVKSKNYYSCESMFHKEDNTSKYALYCLIQKLKSEGVSWIDIQMVTSVCESFGGELISKKKFLKKIGL